MAADTETAVLAGGCFRGMQELLRDRDGVMSTRVGYTGGENENPTDNNHPGHAEAVEVVFDPGRTSYRDILEFFFQVHDPTTRDRQGEDAGSEYRSEIFCANGEQRQIAEATIADVHASGLWPGPVVTEVSEADAFWEAKAEGQDYLQRHPNGPACHFPRPGWKLPRRYQEEGRDSTRWLGFPFRAGDIVISTPSNTGTTWAMGSAPPEDATGPTVSGEKTYSDMIVTISGWTDTFRDTGECALSRLDGSTIGGLAIGLIPCCRPLPPTEGEVGDAAGTVHGLNLESVFEPLQTVPEPLPAAQHNRHHGDVSVVDQVGGQEFADGGRAAANADIPARGGLARLRKRLRGAGVEEVKRGAAAHLDRGAGMVGKNKDRGVERRGVSPPSVPLLVRPGSMVRAELAPPHDFGADARGPSAGESVVDAGAAAGLALHGAEGTSREEPLVQPGSRMPKRGIQALPRAGAEPIQRHREVVHPDLRHDDLLTSCLTATGTGCRGPPPVRTIHRPKVIRPGTA